MSRPWDIIAYKCEQCGQPLDSPGVCPACRGDKACGTPGAWQDCTPAMPDCDCPVIGYAKLHVPGCRYF